jgi:hypothetical protein
MATEFFIQSSNPCSSPECDADDASLSDAVQTVFPMVTESMIMVWSGVYIPLGYKYDVSLMVDDIIDLCNDILLTKEGRRCVHWPSNTFAAVWDVAWDSSAVTVNAQWSRVVGGMEAMLASKSSISVPRADFLAEWKRPLEIADGALHRAGYKPEQIPRLVALHDLVARLPQYGRLYSDASS